MEGTSLAFGWPVWAEVEKFIHIYFHEANIYTPICTYFTSSDSLGRSVTSQDIVAVLCIWTVKIGFLWLGFHPQNIGPHLLHSGVTMTLNQDGISDSNIKAIGWWRSKSFLIYLQGQFLSFSKILTVSMKDVIWFSGTARYLYYFSINGWLPIGPFFFQFHLHVQFHLSFLLSYSDRFWVSAPTSLWVSTWGFGPPNCLVSTTPSIYTSL